MGMKLADETVAALFSATMASRDDSWSESSVQTVREAWAACDHQSDAYDRFAPLLDRETLERCGIELGDIRALEFGVEGETYDPDTGCSRLGKDVGLLACLSKPELPFYGALVVAGDMRLRCLARRKHLFVRRTEWMPGGEAYPGEIIDKAMQFMQWQRQPFGPPPKWYRWWGTTKWKLGRWETETVCVAGACFVEREGESPSLLFSTDRWGIFSQADFLSGASATPWAQNRQVTPGPRHPKIMSTETVTGGGFRRPDASEPDFYSPGTVEFQPGPCGGATPGWALLTPYLRVAVAGESILFSATAVRLHRQTEYHRRHPKDPYARIGQNRSRDVPGYGWDTRVIRARDMRP